MKKTGDFMLYIGDEETGRKITEIEYTKRNSGTFQNGRKNIKTYYLKYKSFDYPDDFKYYGMVRRFILHDSKTNKSIKYEIGKKPIEI